jgi:hypothetical protein
MQSSDASHAVRAGHSPNWDRPLRTADDRRCPLGHPPDWPLETQISFNSRPITPRTVASGHQRFGHLPSSHRCRSWPLLSPLAGPPNGGWGGRPRSWGRAVGERGWASLADRLCDLLQLCLGLLGRGGGGQGAVEGGGQGLGDGQGGKLGADQPVPGPGRRPSGSPAAGHAAPGR